MIYLDNAATTFPKPPMVIQAVSACMRKSCGNPGRGGHALSMAAAELVYRCRCAAASFFGLSKQENVIFTFNATHALNLVLCGVLHPGDSVLYSGLSHNSVRRPILYMERCGVRAQVYPVLKQGRLLSDAEILSEIEKRMIPQTKLLAVTHLSNLCAAQEPLKQIGMLCHKRGVLLLVDASQSAGVLPIHMEQDHIDYLCCAGHKGLYGPQGSGLLLIGPGAPIPEPLFYGGSGVFSKDPQMPPDLPERLEAGTLCVPAVAGLLCGISILQGMGMSAVFAQHKRIGAMLQEILQTVPHVHLYLPQQRCLGTALFAVEGQLPEQTAQRLDEAGVCVRAGLHCAPLAHQGLGSESVGGVRVSAGIFTAEWELERFGEILKNISAE